MPSIVEGKKGGLVSVSGDSMYVVLPNPVPGNRPAAVDREELAQFIEKGEDTNWDVFQVTTTGRIVEFKLSHTSVMVDTEEMLYALRND